MPRVSGQQILLDTGCVMGGWLSCGVLDARQGALEGCIQVAQDGGALRELGVEEFKI
jgi:hypothetical protein